MRSGSVVAASAGSREARLVPLLHRLWVTAVTAPAIYQTYTVANSDSDLVTGFGTPCTLPITAQIPVRHTCGTTAVETTPTCSRTRSELSTLKFMLEV